MSDDLLKSLMGALGPDTVQQLAGKVGASPQQAQSAVASALPLLLGALGKNASQPQGAQALHAALSKKHMGLDPQQVLGQVLGGGGQGQAILGHVLGARQNAAASAVGQTSGLGKDQAGNLLSMLAPMVLAALGKQTAQGGLDANALAGLLGQQRQAIGQQGGVASQLMNAVLDKDGDGDVDLSDIMAAASGKSSAGHQGGLGGLLGKVFGK